MVTYCTGSARQKREYFDAGEYLVLDNTEVLFCASVDGHNYFAYGDVPFKDFTVKDYIAYKRALESTPPDLRVLDALGVKPNKKLGRLSVVQLRAVYLVAERGTTAKKTVVNLDGTRYSRRTARELGKLLAFLPEAFVCVTDARFVEKAGTAQTMAFGGAARGRRPSFYAAKLLAARIDAKRVAVFR